MIKEQEKGFMMNKVSLWCVGCGLLCVVLNACTPKTAPSDEHSNNHSDTNTNAVTQLSDTQHNPQHNITPNTTPNADPEAIIDIDWTALQTGITPIDPDGYAYPFAPDSEPVKNYAQAFNITAKQAQHSMMLAMASPEALGKVLDQIQGHYLGHSLIDGKEMTLIVYTDSAVAPSAFDYVFADKFGEGLVLPIVVKPKQQTVPQVSIASLHNKMASDN